MTLRTLFCAVLVLSLSGCMAHGGDRYSRGWGQNDYQHDRERRDDGRVVIIYQQGHDRYQQRYDQRYDQRHDQRYNQRYDQRYDQRYNQRDRDRHSNRQGGHRDNRDYSTRGHSGQRDQNRGWDQQQGGNSYYQVPQYDPQRHNDRGGVRLYSR
ncbi:MAG: hypothetical protein V4812_21885 [Pseudomonadota bacterium]